MQAGAGQESSGGWVFTSLPHADLWFHGMALVDPIGPGPNPLYDPSYPGEVALCENGARAWRHLPWTNGSGISETPSKGIRPLRSSTSFRSTSPEQAGRSSSRH